MATQADDDALMRQAGEGDRVACRTLVQRHLRPVTAFAWRVLGNREDAEDVAQETFLRLWTEARRWQPGRAKLSTWLFRVAHNLAVDRLRARRPSVDLDAIADPADGRPDPAQAYEQDETARRVAAALAELPDRQRTAIALCHHQGLSNADAAEVMGVGVEAVESLLARGRRTLRQRLMEDGRR